MDDKGNCSQLNKLLESQIRHCMDIMTQYGSMNASNSSSDGPLVPISHSPHRKDVKKKASRGASIATIQHNSTPASGDASLVTMQHHSTQANGDDPLAKTTPLRKSPWFFVSFKIFFSDNTRVRIFIFLSRKAGIFFPEFNIRLYDKNSESIYFFFLHQYQNIFSSNIGNQNIFLEKKHNPPPPPPLQVKWSFPYGIFYLDNLPGLATIQTFKEIYALNIYFNLLLKFIMHISLYG